MGDIVLKFRDMSFAVDEEELEIVKLQFEELLKTIPHGGDVRRRMFKWLLDQGYNPRRVIALVPLACDALHIDQG